MDTRQWTEPPGAPVGLLQPWALDSSNVCCLTTDVVPQVLMVVRKGHNVVVPWPGYDLFCSQPLTHGGFRWDNVAFLLF